MLCKVMTYLSGFVLLDNLASKVKYNMGTEKHRFQCA